MGYSYYIVARSKKLRDRMRDFLNATIPDVSLIHPSLGGHVKTYWADQEALGYVKGKDKPLAVGIEVISTTDPAHFFLEVLKWAAGKVGKTRPLSTLEPCEPYDSGKAPSTELPYLVYDGTECLSATPIPDLAQHWRYWSNKTGRGKTAAECFYQQKLELFEPCYDISLPEFQTLLQQTLQRLETAWKDEEPFAK